MDRGRLRNQRATLRSRPLPDRSHHILIVIDRRTTERDRNRELQLEPLLGRVLRNSRRELRTRIILETIRVDNPLHRRRASARAIGVSRSTGRDLVA